MAGLVPAIRVFLTYHANQDVDGRDKRGHDESWAHNPNTYSMVALGMPRSSGERAILARPTLLMPEAMAMYCLPSTAKVMGGAEKPVPILTFHSSSSVWSS